MAPRKVILKVRDLLSYCGIGFLIAYAFQTMWAVPGLTLVRQHRLAGLFILLSALSISHRLNAEISARRSAARALQEQA